MHFLRRKSIAKTGPGFGYGFIVAWAFVMSFFTLMCGLVMEGFTLTVETQLTAGESETAQHSNNSHCCIPLICSAYVPLLNISSAICL